MVLPWRGPVPLGMGAAWTPPQSLQPLTGVPSHGDVRRWVAAHQLAAAGRGALGFV